MTKYTVTKTDNFDYYEESPHWFEVLAYYLRALFTGIGLVTALLLLCFWSVK